ncbi:hypothetical protein ACFL6Y_11030, partial [Elusimicrobiota bacterium]
TFSPGADISWNYSGPGASNLTSGANYKIVAKSEDSTLNMSGEDFVTVTYQASASQIAFKGPSYLEAGQCSPYYTAELQDSNNNPIMSTYTRTVTLGGEGSGDFYNDYQCTNIITTIPIYQGYDNRFFFYKNSSAESVTLTASASGLTAGNKSVTVAGSADSTAPAITIISPTNNESVSGLADIAGTASDNVQVDIVNIGIQRMSDGSWWQGSYWDYYEYKTPMYVTPSANVSWNFSGPGASNLNSGTSYRIVAHAGDSSYNVSPTTSVIVSYGATATKLKFMEGPSYINQSNCASYRIELQGTDNNPVDAVSPITVNLSGAGNGAFYNYHYSCESDYAPIVAFSFFTGDNDRIIFFKDATAETVSLQASASGLTTANRSVTVSATADNTAPQVAITAPSNGASVTDLSGIAGTATDNIQVDVVNIGIQRMSDGMWWYESHWEAWHHMEWLSLTPGATVFWTFSGPGASNLTSGSQYRIVARSGDSSFNESNETSVIVTYQAQAAKLAFKGPSYLEAGQCSPYYTVVLQDSSNNPIMSTYTRTVTLGGEGSGAFYKDYQCVNVITWVPLYQGNDDRVFWYKNNSAESVTLTASAASLTTANKPVTVSAGADSTAPQISILAPANAESVTNLSDINGTATDNVQVDVVNIGIQRVSDGFWWQGTYWDYYMHDAPVSVDQGSSVSWNFSGPGASNLNSGTSYRIVARAGDSSYNVSLDTSVVVSYGATAAKLKFMEGPSYINQSNCASYRVELQDANNNPVFAASNIAVTLGGEGNGGFYYSFYACNNDMSTISTINMYTGNDHIFFVFKDATAESLDLTASASGLTSGNKSVTVSATADGELPQVLITYPNNEATVSNLSGVLGTATDNTQVDVVNVGIQRMTDGMWWHETHWENWHNLIPVTLTPGTTVSWTFSGPGAFNLTNGQYRIVASAGDSSFNMSVEDSIIVTYGATADKLMIRGPSYLQANQCSTLYDVEPLGINNNLVNAASDISVTLSATAGTFYTDYQCSVSTGAVVIYEGTDISHFHFKHTAAADVTITASASGLTSINKDVTISASVDNTAPQVAILSPSDGTTVSSLSDISGTATDDTQVDVVDIGIQRMSDGYWWTRNYWDYYPYYDPIAVDQGANVSWSFSGPGAANLRNGESYRIVATAGDSFYNVAPDTSAVVVYSALANRLFIAGPVNLGTYQCSPVYKVKTRDSNSMDTSVDADLTVNLASTGSGMFYSDSQCKVPINSVTIYAGTSEAPFYFRDYVQEIVDVTVSAASFTSDIVSVNIGSSQDSTIPVISISSPADLATITDLSQINGTASDNSEIIEVRIGINRTSDNKWWYNGIWVAGEMVEPISITQGATVQWNMSGPGINNLGDELDYRIVARAMDSSFLMSADAAANVTFNAQVARLDIAGPTAAAANTCSAAFTAYTQDINSNNANVASDTNVNLTNNGSGIFYSDNSCASAISSITVLAGSQNAAFYFKDAVSESVLITATATALTGTNHYLTVSASQDTTEPTSGISSPQTSTIINTLSDIRGTASDDTRVDEVLIGIENIVSGKWWSDTANTWVTSANPIYNPVSITQDSAITWTYGGPGVNDLSNGAQYRILAICRDSAFNVQSAADQVQVTFGADDLAIIPSGQTFYDGLGIMGTADRAMPGAPYRFEVVVMDSDFNRLNDYRGAVSFESSDSGAVLPPDFQFTFIEQGQREFYVTFSQPSDPIWSLRAKDVENNDLSHTVPIVVEGAANAGTVSGRINDTTGNYIVSITSLSAISASSIKTPQAVSVDNYNYFEFRDLENGQYYLRTFKDGNSDSTWQASTETAGTHGAFSQPYPIFMLNGEAMTDMVLYVCDRSTITSGDTLSGSLSSTDECYAFERDWNNYAKIYTFDGTQGHKFAADLIAQSTKWDTYLYLIGPDGNLLRQDNDGAGSGDSRIVNYELPTTGVYTLIATSFDPYVQGSFNISLTVTDPASFGQLGDISGTITHAEVGTHQVVARLFTNSTLTGVPFITADADGSGNYSFASIPQDTYYVDAFMDYNSNNIWEAAFEPRGALGGISSPQSLIIDNFTYSYSNQHFALIDPVAAAGAGTIDVSGNATYAGAVASGKLIIDLVYSTGTVEMAPVA